MQIPYYLTLEATKSKTGVWVALQSLLTATIATAIATIAECVVLFKTWMFRYLLDGTVFYLEFWV